MQACSHKPQPVQTAASTVGVKRPPRAVSPWRITSAPCVRSGQAFQQLLQAAAPMKL